MEQSNNFYKENESDQIWWVDNPDEKGVWLFSFDKVTIFNLFQDYPYKLTAEQKQFLIKKTHNGKISFLTGDKHSIM